MYTIYMWLASIIRTNTTFINIWKFGTDFKWCLIIFKSVLYTSHVTVLKCESELKWLKKFTENKKVQSMT